VSAGSVEQVANVVRGAHARGVALHAIDLCALNRIVEFAPEDMIVTAETGMTLASLQNALAEKRQWLPVDPPDADNITIRDLIAHNLSGPRRYAYGTIREHLIGLKVVLADGRAIKSGGKVVKNVAGYDLAKLFIGARDTLGVVVEATFKLRPLPELESFLAREVDAARINDVVHAVLASGLTPVVLDAHRLMPESAAAIIVLGLAGTRGEVTWQAELAQTLGFNEKGSLSYDAEFRRTASPIHHFSVLPSRLTQALVQLEGRRFVARAGNGVVYHEGDPVLSAPATPTSQEPLACRLRAAFDPKRIFPELGS
jgi:FAD/FMN-containing dehydrogenase